MSYVFTTIAIGKKYFLSACNFARNLNKISKGHKIIIVTDCPFVEIENVDFIYERPHSIGSSKWDIEKCFWRHKVEPYGLLKTNFYDNAQVVNEQFLVFKNNQKLKVFVQKWKERNEFGVKNDIWAFAEGVEIGMSAVDAKMVMDWKKMFELRNFFKFVANTGVTHIRF